MLDDLRDARLGDDLVFLKWQHGHLASVPLARPEEHRIRGRFHVHHHRQRVIVHLDGACRVACGVAAGGHHRHHGVAHGEAGRVGERGRREACDTGDLHQCQVVARVAREHRLHGARVGVLGVHDGPG